METALRQARRKALKTQGEIAHEIGLSTVSVCSYEQSCGTMRLDNLRKWYQACSHEGRELIEEALLEYLRKEEE